MGEHKRIVGIDFVRMVAVVSVICGHFFSVNTPYNQTPFEGVPIFIQGVLKSFFCNVGVPFFLLLTGFLCSHKTLSTSYYKSIERVLLPYVFISVITWLILSETHTVKELVLGILGFKTIGYAWYVEMYIGLFLLIPFVNIALNDVFKNGRTRYLLFTAILMTAIPAFLNRNGITLVPGFWMMTFPLAFYIIGATVHHYQPDLKNRALGIVGALCLFAIGPCSEAILHKQGIDASLAGTYYSLINMGGSSLLFVSLYNLSFPKWLSRVFEFCAVAAFETFLFSYMFDKLLYPLFIGKFYVTQARFIVWFIPITVSVFILSLLSAYIYKQGIDLIDKARSYVKNRSIR